MVRPLQEIDSRPLLVSSMKKNDSQSQAKKITRFLSPTVSPTEGYARASPREHKLYPRRWINLSIFSLITMSNSCLWITLTSITDVVESYYHLKPIYVDWLSLAFFIVCGITALPGVYFLSSLGLRTCILIAALLNAVGSSTRILGLDPNWFVFVAVGQCISATGTTFALAVAPKLAAVWFSEHERTTATAIATLMNIFGVCVGFLQASIMVGDVSSIKLVRFALFRLLASQSLFCWALLLVAVLFVSNAPPTPPTVSETLKAEIDKTEKPKFIISIYRIMLNLDYIIVCTAYALNFACEVSLSILFNQMIKQAYLKHSIVSDNTIGWLGFIGTFCGLPASLLAALLLDRFKYYKIAATFCLFFSLIFLAWFSLLLLQAGSFYLLSVAFCFFNVFSCPYFSVGLDHAAEMSYPVPEDVASGIPLAFSNVLSFIFTYVFQLCIDHNKLDSVLYGYCGILATGCLLSLLASSEQRRDDVDTLS